MEYKIKFEIGDPSGDGHEKSTDLYIQSNYSKDQLEEAYNNSVKKLGVGFSNRDFQYVNNEDLLVAVNYSEPHFGRKVFFKLKEININPFNYAYQDNEDDDPNNPEQDEFYIDGSENLLYLILDVIKHFHQDFEYKIIQDNTPIFSKSFGYGLFY